MYDMRIKSRTGLLLLALLLLATPRSYAQVTLASGYVLQPADALGPDKPYDFSETALHKAPKGYEAFCIEHYGRHGSRYAYEAYFYQDLWNAFQKADAQGLLTEQGRRIYTDYRQHYDHYLLHVGELTALGWEQHRKIAERMYDAFPGVFARGATVTALASGSYRSILSMSACCLSLQARAPRLQIRELQGLAYLKDTHPRDARNPLLRPWHKKASPLAESPADFQARRVDAAAVLGRLFMDVEAACGEAPYQTLLGRLYILTAGMQSLREEERTCFDGLFSETEFAGMAEWLNYLFYTVYYGVLPPTASVSDGIIADADRRIRDGERGATLRFGHDHVLMPLLRLLGINGQDWEAPSPDEVSRHYHIWDCPMAGNIQFVFYRPKAGRSGDILFKVLLNGREATLAIPAAQGPYYHWQAFKEWYAARIAALS
ncbi:MAG: hypothetical protein J5871_02760 [Bacteroidales bacterium]|nr:hypothetical protein [Bacteroidales bacterium]